MKYQVFRAKTKKIDSLISMDNYNYEDEYEAATKGDLSYRLGKYFRIRDSVKPLNLADLVVDENNKAWVLTEHMLWAEVTISKD